MEKLIAVGAGGCLGALLRYGMVTWLPRHSAIAEVSLPVPTLAVNLLGCLLIGFFKAMVDHTTWISPNVGLFLFTGALGSFTTFSTFGFESWSLLEQGRIGILLSYVLISVVFGLLLVWLGLAMGTRWLENP